MGQRRAVEQIFQGPPTHWVGDGFHVSSLLPTGLRSSTRLSPFFLLDYHAPYTYAATSNLRRGVGPHPHRGLETVSLAFAGAVAHHDSAGNSGVIQPGDVQWMTAGAGILHKEYHAETFAKAGGVLHMVQLWVNLPKAHKFTAPKYQGITSAQIPTHALARDGGLIRVIAGRYGDAKGPASTFSPIDLFDLRLNQGAQTRLHFSPTANTGLLLLQGALQVNEQDVQPGSFVVFANTSGDIELAATAPQTMVLVMSGEPLHEPVVAHGPFLMNTAAQIQEAFADFNDGKFGELAD